MDPNTLVEGGAAGLERVATSLGSKGLTVLGIYLIKLTSNDGFEDWIIRVVTPPPTRDLVVEIVGLRRAGQLPMIASEVRMSAVSPDHEEASRVIDYAQRIGDMPVVIRGVLWNGLFIEYALVARYPRKDIVAA